MSKSIENSVDSCGDDTFGPVVNSTCYGGLDFTLLFEETFFVIVPCSIFILLAALRVIKIYSRPHVRKYDALFLAKLGLAGALIATQIASLVLWTLASSFRAKTAVAATSLELVSSIMIGVLVSVEYVRTRRPSTILSLFLLLMALLDIARIRTLATRVSAVDRLIVAILSMCLMFALLIVEIYKEKAPEHTLLDQDMGVVSDSLMLWLWPIMRLGYSKSIKAEDLPSSLNGLQTVTIARDALDNWSRARQDRKHALAMTVFWLCRRSLFLQMLPRLSLIGFSVAQPFLIERFITVISNHSDSSAYLFVPAFAFVYIGIAISTIWYQVLTVRTITAMRGSLISLIYFKTLDLPESQLKDAAAVSLVTADVERISTSIEYAQNLWADLIQIGLGTYILSIYVSAVSVAAIIMALISSTAAGQLGKLIGPRQRAWFAQGQQRIKATTRFLNNIKSIKWSGLETVVQSDIRSLRMSQIAKQKRFRHVQIMMITLGNFSATAAPFVVFLVYAVTSLVESKVPISLANAFAALSSIALLVAPIGEIVGILPNIGASLSCFSTIQSYLLREGSITPRPQGLNVGDATLARDTVTAHADSTTKTEKATLLDEGQIAPSRDSVYARFDNASLSVESSNGPLEILKNITATIPCGGLTVVFGPTGCGKSTLIKLLCGEINATTGSVATRPGAIGLCSQSAWIACDTVRENIVGPNSFDQLWYSNVLEACALSRELENLPEGDSTIIGGKGGSLSGGQMARIALARAVYSKASALILDEPFSSLDPKTATHCFRRLLGKSGLLSNGSTTSVLVTSQWKWLSYATYTIILDANGCMTVSGAHGKQQDFSEIHNLESDLDRLYGGTRSAAGTLGAGKKTDLPVHATSQVVESPTPVRMKDLKLILAYLGTMPYSLMAVLLIMMLGQVGLVSIQPLWLNFWINYNLGHPNECTGYYFGIYAVFAVGGLSLLCGCACLFFLYLVPISSQNLHDRLLANTVEAPLSFFQNIGIILNHFTQDLMFVDMQLPLAFLLTAENGISSTAQLILVSISTGYVALSIPGILLVLYIVQHVYLRTSKQVRLLDLAAKAPIYSHFTDTISGAITIRQLRWQDHFTSKNYQVVDSSQSPYYIMLCIQKWLTLVLNLVVAALAVLLVSTIVALRNQVDPGLLGVSLISILGLGQTLSYFLTFWTSLETSLGAISRIETFIAQISKHNTDKTNTKMPPTWPLQGDLRISKLSAGYDGHIVLYDITCSIPMGQRVKIYGSSGSGKSSLLASILGLVEVQEGNVCIDGQDISKIDKESLRQAVFAVPQNLCFVAKTIRDNLTSGFKHSISDQELEQRLSQVSLWLKISSFSDGLSTVWTDELFSDGQKQLFAFAKAMLSSCPIIIIDEISSQLDDDSVMIIQGLMTTGFSGRTVLMITHDTRTSFKFDREIQIEGGEIVSDELPK